MTIWQKTNLYKNSIKIKAGEIQYYNVFVSNEMVENFKPVFIFWTFKVATDDLKFTVQLKKKVMSEKLFEEFNEEMPAVISGNSRIQANSKYVTGMFQVIQPGIYSLAFDNSYSYFKTKSAKFRYFLIRHSETKK